MAGSLCRSRDLNPDALRRGILSPLRIPVPPLRRGDSLATPATALGAAASRTSREGTPAKGVPEAQHLVPGVVCHPNILGVYSIHALAKLSGRPLGAADFRSRRRAGAVGAAVLAATAHDLRRYAIDDPSCARRRAARVHLAGDEPDRAPGFAGTKSTKRSKRWGPRFSRGFRRGFCRKFCRKFW